MLILQLFFAVHKVLLKKSTDAKGMEPLTLLAQVPLPNLNPALNNMLNMF